MGADPTGYTDLPGCSRLLDGCRLPVPADTAEERHIGGSYFLPHTQAIRLRRRLAPSRWGCSGAAQRVSEHCTGILSRYMAPDARLAQSTCATTARQTATVQAHCNLMLQCTTHAQQTVSRTFTEPQ